jgi:exportin-T
MYGVMDELFSPLNAHIAAIVNQPPSGSDDLLSQIETKKAYLGLLNSIMTSPLYGVLTSERKCNVCV